MCPLRSAGKDNARVTHLHRPRLLCHQIQTGSPWIPHYDNYFILPHFMMTFFESKLGTRRFLCFLTMGQGRASTWGCTVLKLVLLLEFKDMFQCGNWNAGSAWAVYVLGLRSLGEPCLTSHKHSKETDLDKSQDSIIPTWGLWKNYFSKTMFESQKPQRNSERNKVPYFFLFH